MAAGGGRMYWLPLVAAMGCKQLPNMRELKDLLPEVQFDELKVDDIDFQRLEAKFVLDVTNPYPVELDLAETSWKLGLAGSPFLDGTNEKGTVIAASETSKVRIPFTMRWADAFAVVSQAREADTMPYTLDADLGFDSPVGRVDVPLHREGDMPALHAPKISLKGLRVAGLDLAKQTATIEVDLGLDSEQASALTFEAFEYGLKLAGNDVASGRAQVGSVQDSKTVTLPADIRLVALGEAAIEALTKKKPVKVRLTGDASVGTPFGVVPFDFDESADLTPR
jgi:hypothetical protein